ncbi:MAG TPA: alcohol dehydrogenase catalytic domain-containing protein [Polyangiaceae bacterium]|nr:alcohol dehydrogenase catalytic domain-containing protein [Polyangiaceae bacterium]
MRAVVFDLSIPRYVVAKAIGKVVLSLYDGANSCLRVRSDVSEPALPGDAWVRLRPIACGLCGTDVATVYFKHPPSVSPYASFPFIPGHEVLATVAEVGRAVRAVREGDRVVVDPWLNCRVRATEPCARCAGGEYQVCERTALGPLKGMILGGCAELPGGLAELMVAHESQLFPVPTYVADGRAVLTEPLAVAVHAVLRNAPSAGERVLVIGGGPIAFCTVVALGELGFDTDITLYSLDPTHLDKARALGAHRALCPSDGQLVDLAAVLTRAPRLTPVLGRDFLAGGFDRVFDCVGTATSLADAFAVTRPGGTIVMVGAAGVMPKLDLSFLWTKEIRLVGTLGYGFEDRDGARRRTFDIALDILASADRPIEDLVTHRFPFEQVRDALRANLFREKSGALKTVLYP